MIRRLMIDKHFRFCLGISLSFYFYETFSDLAREKIGSLYLMVIKYFGSPNFPVCRIAIIVLVSNFKQASDFQNN